MKGSVDIPGKLTYPALAPVLVFVFYDTQAGNTQILTIKHVWKSLRKQSYSFLSYLNFNCSFPKLHFWTYLVCEFYPSNLNLYYNRLSITKQQWNQNVISSNMHTPHSQHYRCSLMIGCRSLFRQTDQLWSHYWMKTPVAMGLVCPSTHCIRCTWRSSAVSGLQVSGPELLSSTEDWSKEFILK